VIACSNGANGRYRLSGLVAAVVLLLIILVASDVVAIIPTSALVSVMAVVCWATFEWSMPGMVLAAALPRTARNYIGLHRKVRRMDVIVMLAVTLVTIFADLFTAVLVGIGVSAVDFSWQQAQEVTVFSQLVPLEKGDERLLGDGDEPADGGEAPAPAAEVKEGDSATGDAAAAAADRGGPGADQGDAKAAVDGEEAAAGVKAPRAARVSAILEEEATSSAAAATTAAEGSEGSSVGDGTPSTKPLVKHEVGVAVAVDAAAGRGAAAEGVLDADAASAAADDAVADGGSGDEEAPAAPGSPVRVKRVYVVTGSLFFASAMDFVKRFSPEVMRADPPLVEFRFDDATIGDYSGMHALATVSEKYAAVGKRVVVKRLGVKSFKLVTKADHLIQHFEYEAAADDEDVESEMRSRSSYQVRDGLVDPPTKMHIELTQPHLRT